MTVQLHGYFRYVRDTLRRFAKAESGGAVKRGIGTLTTCLMTVRHKEVNWHRHMTRLTSAVGLLQHEFESGTASK